MNYNLQHGITPRQVKKNRNSLLATEAGPAEKTDAKAYQAYTEPTVVAADPVISYMSKEQLQKSIERTRKLMQEAAKKLEFIEAAQYRDELLRLEDLLKTKA